MSDLALIGAVAMVTAGLTIAIGSIGPALGEGMAVARALGRSPSSPTKRTLLPAPYLWV